MIITLTILVILCIGVIIYNLWVEKRKKEIIYLFIAAFILAVLGYLIGYLLNI